MRNALAVQERVFGPMHPRVASAVNELGTVARQKGDTEEAKVHFQRMLDIYRSVYPGGHYLTGTATANLASAHLVAHDNVGAERLLREAIGVFPKTLAPGNLNIGIARVKLGRAVLRQKRFAEALVETEAGYAILRNQMNPSVSWPDSARADLLGIYGVLGRTEKQAAVKLEHAAASSVR